MEKARATLDRRKPLYPESSQRKFENYACNIITFNFSARLKNS